MMRASSILLPLFYGSRNNNKRVEGIASAFLYPTTTCRPHRSSSNWIPPPRGGRAMQRMGRDNDNNNDAATASSVATADVVVVGGGVSGMVAAVTTITGTNDDPVANNNNNTTTTVVVLEAQDRVGGRVQTDSTTTTTTSPDDDASSFRFDRGFAVFVEEYPMSQQLLDYDALDLRPFVPGAIVMTTAKGRRVRIVDPLRQPSSLWDALRCPIGTLQDRIQLVRLLWHVRTRSLQELWDEDEIDTESVLRNRWHLSDSIIDQFFRPFLQGIYLCALDQQSSRMFHCILRMFSRGRVSLPARGMAAVAAQLQERCTTAGVHICTHTKVDSVEGQPDGTFRVSCNGGSKLYDATTVIVATESPVTHRLLQPMMRNERDDKEEQRQQRAVGCVYYSFSGKAPPIDEPILVLNGTGQGPVNNLCFPTVVSPLYATPPRGTTTTRHHLCSVTVLESQLQAYPDDRRLDHAVREQLSAWFPEANTSDDWKLERIYRIPNAQPAQYQPGRHSSTTALSTLEPSYGGGATTVSLPPGVFVCGDHTTTASLQGALTSGVRVGEQVIVRQESFVATQ